MANDNDPVDPFGTDDDLSLFRETVGPVKRIFHDRADVHAEPPEATPRSTLLDQQQIREDMLSGPIDASELDTGEELYYCRAGVQHSVLRRLRRGQYRVHAILDLHGMNVAAARSAFTEFLLNAKRNHLSCVRIIHGKGKRSRHKGPVLKTKVNHWLRQREDVLAFCSARSVDGGTGAVYVLLRS